MSDKKNPAKESNEQESPMSWDKTVEKVNAELNQIAELKEQAKHFSSELLETRKRMDAALKAGKSSDFTEFAKSATAQQGAIISTEQRIAAAQTFTTDSIVNAWNSHIEESNMAFSEKFRDYQRAVNELRDMYLELVEMQRKALKERSTAADILCKISPNNPATRYESNAVFVTGRLEDAYILWGLNPPKFLPEESQAGLLLYEGFSVPPDLGFYVTSGSIDRSKFATIRDIVKYHKPSKKGVL